jgi:hypothetical protein
VSQWEREQVSKYPEIRVFIEKLKSLIKEKPESGLQDPIFLPEIKKALPCRKRSVSIALFPNRYVLGCNYITATYFSSGDDVVIARMDYS